jgi:hypothetical protein
MGDSIVWMKEVFSSIKIPGGFDVRASFYFGGRKET